MTYEAALEAAKGGLEVYESKYPHLVEQIEFQKIVIKALEKQTPKRLEVQWGIPCCPNCGYGQDDIKKASYCQSCGQLLDWGRKTTLKRSV